MVSIWHSWSPQIWETFEPEASVQMLSVVSSCSGLASSGSFLTCCRKPGRSVVLRVESQQEKLQLH